MLKKQQLRRASIPYAKNTAFFLIAVFLALWEITSMNQLEKGHMSRRERQIMDILYRLGQASAKEVLDNLPDPPSYSAVRALMATLEAVSYTHLTLPTTPYV